MVGISVELLFAKPKVWKLTSHSRLTNRELGKEDVQHVLKS